MIDKEQTAQLIKTAQHGDADAFLLLLGSMKEPLYRTALAYLHRQDLAMQAIEDASYSAYLHIRQLKKPEYAATWLTRILINACLKHLRRENRTQPMAALPEPAAPDDAAGMDLRDAVSRLPDDLRVVVSVRYYGGMTVPETAGILGLPEGTVKTRLRKAVSLLKLELEV
jgi:RNA polymerase sigma factor (sigma-70 family)